MIEFNNKLQIKSEIDSIKGASFIKSQTIRDREGIFKQVHFKASHVALNNIQLEFTKQALLTNKKDVFILEYKKQGTSWI